MKTASGLLITTFDFKDFLLFKRSLSVSSSGKYSVPGGMRKSDNSLERPLETALREAQEEIGQIPFGKINPTPFEYVSPKGLHYFTFVLEIDLKTKRNYVLQLDREHDSYVWIKRNELSNYNLHQGLENVFSQIFTLCHNQVVDNLYKS